MKWVNILDVSVYDMGEKRMVINDTKPTKEELIEQCQDIADFYLQYCRVEDLENPKIKFRII